ncbi:MAG: hypothetical protein P8Y10_15465 [Gemmatimonadales bacterium]
MRLNVSFFDRSMSGARMRGGQPLMPASKVLPDDKDVILAEGERIGYLAEHAPAYGERTVDSFLRFAFRPFGR